MAQVVQQWRMLHRLQVVTCPEQLHVVYDACGVHLFYAHIIQSMGFFVQALTWSFWHHLGLINVCA